MTTAIIITVIAFALIGFLIYKGSKAKKFTPKFKGGGGSENVKEKGTDKHDR
jgi:hypothetical protein